MVELRLYGADHDITGECFQASYVAHAYKPEVIAVIEEGADCKSDHHNHCDKTVSNSSSAVTEKQQGKHV